MKEAKVPALSIRVFKDQMWFEVFPQILASFSVTNGLSSVEPKPLPQPCGLDRASSRKKDSQSSPKNTPAKFVHLFSTHQYHNRSGRDGNVY
jgi:hypothetical protein